MSEQTPLQPASPAVPPRTPDDPAPPHGTYPTRLDDRGRLKLPADFVKYFNKLADKLLYVTCLDGRTVQIYTDTVWRATLIFLQNFPDPVQARQMTLLGDALGADTQMDAQGRIQFPAKLREHLHLAENSPLQMRSYRQHIEVMPEAGFQVALQAALEAAPKNILDMERAGLP